MNMRSAPSLIFVAANTSEPMRHEGNGRDRLRPVRDNLPHPHLKTDDTEIVPPFMGYSTQYK